MEPMKYLAYMASLINGIPHDVYIATLIVFCLGAAILIGIRGWRKGLRSATGLLLCEYIFLLYCSTVIFRSTAKERAFDFTPFWSYSNPDLVVENVMNAVAFVPVGVLLGIATSRWKSGWLVAMIVGMGISVSIETMQYFMKRGFSEVDDVMHNTLGCLIGFLIVAIFNEIWSLYKRFSTN